MLEVNQHIKNVTDGGISGGYSVTRYSLPNGLYLENKDAFPNIPVTGEGSEPARDVLTLYGNSNPNRSINAREIDTLIWSQSVIKVENSTNIWQ
jgi:hypothetical protein